MLSYTLILLVALFLCIPTPSFGQDTLEECQAKHPFGNKVARNTLTSADYPPELCSDMSHLAPLCQKIRQFYYWEEVESYKSCLITAAHLRARDLQKLFNK